ncbi:P2R1A-PPP2R2A-interacting phosphatase regulator 1-like isoform X2 [Lineus longissimus]|uniref:P2R1A-PPP2R2A-interacting phosphatase regulator 1-like isoform X2 n=1 Tax=Lineus longissimus TaxID=88925 RepID=UPI00315CEDE9
MEGSFPMASSQMEVDLPSTSGSGTNLKRSNSAPMINALPPNTPTEAVPETNRSHTPPLSLCIQQPRPLDSTRVRRFSSSSVALTSINISTSAPLNTTPIKIPSRLHQIKNEEKLNIIVNREAAHEKEVQSAMQISSSWDEFHLDDNNQDADPVHQQPLDGTVGNMHNAPQHGASHIQSNVHSLSNVQDMPMSMNMEASCSNSLGPAMKRQRSYSESLHVFPSLFPLSGSPSPTRVGKQCYSPSMQQPVRNSTLTPSPSPSPTRKTFARSLSPIAMKPSTLGMKRKHCDNDGFSSYMSPPKRFSTGASTPDRQSAPHPLTHSISSSSLEDNSSPEQLVPRGATTTCTIGNMQTHRSPCYTFTPVSVTEGNDNVVMTDSETSEITDISDSSMSHMQMSPVRHGHT